MSKGYVVHPLMKQPREAVIDEALIRDCIYVPQAAATDEERMQILGNRYDALYREKTQRHMREMDLRKVECLLLSYRHIGQIDNLYGLDQLTKLCLDNNRITKIENLGHLTNLRTLDLSYNAISVIEGLDELRELTDLSLYSNQITVVAGLDELKQLVSLSIGRNAIDALDDTAAYLHRLKNLRVLTLKDCRISSAPQYRPKLLAFIPTLRFLDGKAVKPAEIAQAREDQRENLQPIDEQDELDAAAEKTAEELKAAQKEYERYNCPHEGTLYDELLRLQPDGRNVVELIRCDGAISATKEVLERHQNDFNDKAKELADAMKAVRARRDGDEAAYMLALRRCADENLSSSRNLIKTYEKQLKSLSIDSPSGGADGRTMHAQQLELLKLQSDLVEKEADLYDTNEALHNATLARWKTDSVDVLLQSAFESFFKLEGDLQMALRQAFDSVLEQRLRRDRTADDDFLYATSRDDWTVPLLDNREELQKLIGDWFELRRKCLEEKEMAHLKAEERLLVERASTITRQEQDRHRNRLAEITAYIEQALAALEEDDD